MSLKKILISVLLFLSFLVVPTIPHSALAFSTPDGADYEDIYNNAVYGTNEMNLQSFVHEVVKALSMDQTKGIGGCLTSCDADNKSTGLAGMVAYGIGSVFITKPASGIEYLADLGSRLNIVKPAYAQGFGFARMTMVLPMWKAFRDLSYLLFVLVFVITGFAIMFRFKIDPRTVITLESALPKIIIGLILVTFSYAIAGFMIDIMWLVNNIILQIFKNMGPSFSFAPSGVVTSDIQILWFIITAGLLPIVAGLLIFIILGVFGGVIAGIATAGMATPLIGAGVVIAMIIYAIAGLIALLMILFSLLRAYANIIIAIIFAPFQFLAGTLPGGSLGGWFTNLFANLAVLPVTLIMVCISGQLMGTALGQYRDLGNYISYSAIGSGQVFLAKNEGGLVSSVYAAGPKKNWSAVLATFGDATGRSGFPNLFITTLISMTILFMAPKVSDMIKNAMAGKPIGDRIGVGEAFGTAVGMGTPGIVGRLASPRSGTGTLSNLGKNMIPTAQAPTFKTFADQISRRIK